MEKARSIQLLDVFVIFICSMIFFTFGLSQQEIMGFDARFYLFALSMWRHGITWFPMTYQQPYPDYPVVSTLLIYGVSKSIGELSKLTAVLPSAIASAMTLVVTYLIGALHDRRWGLYAAGFLLLTAAFLTASQAISLDMFVTLFTALCFYMAYAAKLQQRRMPLIGMLFCLALSFSVRGPIGLIIPAGVLSIFYLIDRDIKRFFLFAFSSLLLLVICGAILLGVANDVGGLSFMQAVLHMQVFGRMEVSHTPPVYFYFIESMGAYAVTYPLALLVLIGVAPQLIKRQLPADLKFLKYLFVWILIVMIGLSIPADKKIRYILPMAPALALICAYLVALPAKSFYLAGLRRVFDLIWLFLPCICLLFLSFLYQHHIDLNYSVLATALVVMQFVSLFSQRNEIVFLLAVVSFAVSCTYISSSIEFYTNQTRVFVKEIESYRTLHHEKLVFYREDKDGMAIKYLVNMSREEAPVFVTDPLDLPATGLVIATEKNYQQLPDTIRQSVHWTMRGKIGHEPVVVFRFIDN